MSAKKERRANIAVLISGGGTNLQAILDAEKEGALHSGTVKLVISNRKGAYGLERAKNAGVKAVAVTRKECGSQEAFGIYRYAGAGKLPEGCGPGTHDTGGGTAASGQYHGGGEAFRACL